MSYTGKISRAMQTAVLVLACVSLFEFIKHLMLPGITLLESHLITICVTSVCGGTAAFVVFRKQENLTEQLATEVEERRQAEGKYRDLFEKANDAILLVDADLRYLDANRKAEEVLGYSRAELLTMKITDIIPPEQGKRSAEEFEKLQTRGAYENFLGKVRRRDGQLVDVEVSASAIVVDGRVVGSRDILRDITDRKKAEAEREKLIRELQDSVARIRTLSGLLPICAGCKKIRNDKGYWTQIESYLTEYAAAEFTHSLCPDCAARTLEDARRLKEKNSP